MVYGLRYCINLHMLINNYFFLSVSSPTGADTAEKFSHSLLLYDYFIVTYKYKAEFDRVAFDF